MASWTVKKGNTSIQDVLVQDKDGATVANLAAATEIKFEVKKSKQSVSAEITRTVGVGIEVNTPSTGYLRITLTPTNTDISPKEYYMGLQITWSVTLIYEVILKAGTPAVTTDVFTITQDVVN